jgi:hypothetical protein
MAKRTQSRKSAAAPRADGRLIAIRAQDDGKLIEKFVIVTSAPTIVRMAAQWGYILRVRARWAGDPYMRDNFGIRAIDDLEKLGIGRKDLQELASVEHIEVELCAEGLKSADAAVVDAASEIPWEYLLSAATQSLGRFESLLVTRCLPNNSMVAPTKPKNVLFVESSPGRIEYDFDDEEARLRAAVNLREDAKHGRGDGLTFSRTDPITKLRGLLSKNAWEVVHITGVDTHQAAWLVEDFYSALAERTAKVIDKFDRLRMILRGDSNSELPVRYDELADFVLESKKPPRCRHPELVLFRSPYGP